MTCILTDKMKVEAAKIASTFRNSAFHPSKPDFPDVLRYRRFVDSKILPLDMTERERVSTDPQFL